MRSRKPKSNRKNEPEAKPEPQTEAEVSKPESKDEPVAEVKPEAKKRVDRMQEVARELAKEMAEEAKDQPGGAVRDDEATGEFDALSSSTIEKKQTPPDSKPAAKEEPVQEVESSTAKQESKSPIYKKKTQSLPLDQTGEDFKAVAQKLRAKAGLANASLWLMSR